MWQYILRNIQTSQDIEITPKTKMVTISSQLEKQTSEITLQCFDIEGVHFLNEIRLYKNGVLKQAGIIVNQEDYQQGVKKFTNFKCVDFSHRLHYRVIANQYTEDDLTEGKPNKIIKDIVARKAPEFTTNSVRPSTSTLQVLRLPYETVFDSFNKIMGFLNDWYWYVDANLDIHTFQGYETLGPIFREHQNVLMNSVRISYETETLTNRLWILGPRQASNKYTEEFFTADGQSRIYKIGYEPNYTQAFINGAPASIKLESKDDGNQDFLIAKKEKVIYRPDYKDPVASGIVKFRYRPTIEFVDFFEAPNSISTFGLYERAIKNRSLTDRIEARKFGRASLRKTSREKRFLTFVTRQEVKIGQKSRVEMPSWGITNEWLITQVITSLTEKDEIYTIDCKEVI